MSQFVEKLFPGVANKVVVVLAAAIFFLLLMVIASLSSSSEQFLFGDYADVGYGICAVAAIGLLGYALTMSFRRFDVEPAELLVSYGGRIVGLSILTLGSGVLVFAAGNAAGLFFGFMAVALTLVLLGGFVFTVRELSERSQWLLVLSFVIYCNATVLVVAAFLSQIQTS